MTMMFEGQIDCARLSDEELLHLRHYYKSHLKAIHAKILAITDGSMTIMSEHGLELLRNLRGCYWNRIEDINRELNARKKKRN